MSVGTLPWEETKQSTLDPTNLLAHPPVPMYRDYVGLLLDASASMAPREDAAYNVLRQQFENFAALKRRDPSRTTYIHYRTFSTTTMPHIENSITPNVPVRSHYHAIGQSTAILDAVGEQIEALQVYDIPSVAHNTSFLVICITDGIENASRNFDWPDLKRVLAVKQQAGNWTFVFFVPTNRVREQINQQLGVPLGNISVWDPTSDTGTYRMGADLAGSTVSYYAARAAGVRSTKTFFEPDLSGLTAAKAKNALPDMQDHFKTLGKVQKETDITTFVQYKTGQPYVAGQAFYELTKPEDVAPDKLIILMPLKGKQVYADSGVRKVLGMPIGDTVRVKPGNHGNWRIFVQSKSTNRKLVRGTSVLLRKSGQLT